MNNDVRDGWGKLIGFRCRECGEIYQSMWGTICNPCRRELEYHNARMKALKSNP